MKTLYIQPGKNGFTVILKLFKYAFVFMQTYQSKQVNNKQGQGKCNPKGYQVEFTAVGRFLTVMRKGQLFGWHYTSGRTSTLTLVKKSQVVFNPA